MKKIIFSHGRQGRPDGQKIRQLSQIAKAKGWQSHSVDYTDTLDPDIRAQRLIDVVRRQQQPFCLVGSSMGGVNDNHHFSKNPKAVECLFTLFLQRIDHSI